MGCCNGKEEVAADKKEEAVQEAVPPHPEPEPEPEPRPEPEPEVEVAKEPEAAAKQWFDIREPCRAESRRRQPQIKDDAAAPCCMLGSNCEQVRFGMTVPSEMCSYCGIRVCGACRSTEIMLDRWCTWKSEIKRAEPGATQFKAVCDSCCEHAPAEVRRRLRGVALKEAARAAEPDLAQVTLPAEFQVVVKQLEVRAGSARDSKSVAKLVEGDLVSVIARQVGGPPDGDIDAGEHVGTCMWLQTAQGWVPERTKKGRFTLLPQSLLPDKVVFMDVTDPKGVPLKATLNGHRDQSMTSLTKAGQGDRLEVTGIVRTSSGTERADVWTESGEHGWVTSKTKGGKARLSEQICAPPPCWQLVRCGAVQ
eukprot:COSAG02_NODE_1380_length_12986_cov_13.843563_10_plen_365_part_00